MARLLVVDDEQSMRVMLEARLTKAGHAVEVAADVPGVERALAASEFDVVITDLRMRTGDDGLRVLRKVKGVRDPFTVNRLIDTGIHNVTIDSGMFRIAAVAVRMAKGPWVLVQRVRCPSDAQEAVEAWGSM